MLKEINCKEIREQMLTEAKVELTKIFARKGKKLKLAIVQVEGDPASDVYIRNKIKTCEEVGIDHLVVKLLPCVSYATVLWKIRELNDDPTVTGIILQLPLPAHLKSRERDLINAIAPYKDVDGLTDPNVKMLWTSKGVITPATPTAILRLLPDDLSYKTVTVINRSDLVGKPLIKLLLDRNATVSVCHSKTNSYDLSKFLCNSDVIITATGQAEFIDEFDVYNCEADVTLIDVGMNRNEAGKLCGDFHIVDAEDINKRFNDLNYTPVPGGVGILTTAQLMLNLIKCYHLGPKRE